MSLTGTPHDRLRLTEGRKRITSDALHDLLAAVVILATSASRSTHGLSAAALLSNLPHMTLPFPALVSGGVTFPELSVFSSTPPDATCCCSMPLDSVALAPPALTVPPPCTDFFPPSSDLALPRSALSNETRFCLYRRPSDDAAGLQRPPPPSLRPAAAGWSSPTLPHSPPWRRGMHAVSVRIRSHSGDIGNNPTPMTCKVC